VQLATQAMTITDHRVVEVFIQLVDGGRFVGHQGAKSFLSECRARIVADLVGMMHICGLA
jgi:hypothetical protein